VVHEVGLRAHLFFGGPSRRGKSGASPEQEISGVAEIAGRTDGHRSRCAVARHSLDFAFRRSPPYNRPWRISVSKTTIGSLIVLALLVALPGCSKEGSKAPAASAPSTEPHPLPAAAYTAVDTSGIKRVEGGKTVAEVFAEKDQLAGKQVVVRGKVVKTRDNIMGKNWVHVRDGTGAEKTNDLTITTSDPLPTVGATVVVTGQLSKDKDLGLGYKYDVLIEDAKVKTE
jgi:hypothetical protein